MLVVAGCATDRTEYSVTPGGPPLSRESAQNAIVTANLNLQIKPPLDAPLGVVAAPLPVYPMEFQKAQIVGTVRLRFDVEADGTVSNVEVVGSPPAPLAAISVNTLLQWKFTAPKRDGKAVKLRLEHEIKFSVR